MFQGPVKNLKKQELVALANALSLSDSISSSTRKADILAVVENHLSENHHLCEDPRFQGLSAYRPDRTEAKKHAKKSTDKEVEDIKASKTDSKDTITGANQTLFTLKYRTDPAPQHFRLTSGSGSGAQTKKKGHVNGSESPSPTTSSSSLTSLSSGNGPPQAVIPESPPGSPPRAPDSYPTEANNSTDGFQLPDSILVRLFEHMKDNSYTNEIWIPTENGINIDGSRGKYMVSLSEVLPEVFQNHSPIKGGGGRLFRHGVANRDQMVNLGSVDSLLSSNKISFPMKKIDEYELETDNDGNLFFDLFLEKDSKPPRELASSISDSSSLAPLTQARERAMKKQARLAAHEVTKEELYAFIRHEFEVEKIYKTKAKTMYDVVVRQKALADLIKALDDRDWGGAKGGHTVQEINRGPPENYDGQDWNRFIGCAIQKTDLAAVLGLGSSQTAIDARRLTVGVLEHAPEALKWVQKSEPDPNSRFARMTPSQFDKYVKEQDQLSKERIVEERAEKKRRERKKQQKASKRSRHDTSSSERGDERSKRGRYDSAGEEEEEDRPRKSLKEKSKRRNSSSNLDDSSSSSSSE